MSEENYWSELNCLYDNLWSLQWLKSSRGVEKTLWPNCQRLDLILISPNFMFPRNKSLMLSTVVKLAVGFTPLQKQLLFDLWGKVDGCAVPSSQSLRLLPEWWYFSDTLTAGKCKLAWSHPPGTTRITGNLLQELVRYPPPDEEVQCRVQFSVVVLGQWSQSAEAEAGK